MHISGKFLLGHDDSGTDPINDPIKTDLDERANQILRLLRKNPGITRAKMAETLGCSDSTIKRKLAEMASNNIIRRIGSNKKGEWIIMDDMLSPGIVTVDKQSAEEILKEKMADNLVIVESFEAPDAWCFGLGLIDESGDVVPLMGNNTIRVSKETGEIE